MVQQSENDSRNQRNSFLNCVLGKFYKNKEKRKGKYTKLDLDLALDNINGTKFTTFLFYQMPRIILSGKKIKHKVSYFKELDYLLNYVEKKKNKYYSGCFQVQKKRPEKHYLEIIAKQLSKLPDFEGLNQEKKYYGIKQYVEFIKFIMEISKKNDKEAKQILMDYIDNKIPNNSQKKAYVKNKIQQLKIQ
ncbi:unnamed protein product [Paramecium octaurelia]|uniref:Uncharacterized protein n=1 Tax=Paramecium octaurelia TaxID=43137 RepID=A0A8S1X6C9_PAROT|nr:unnamed protein product [Paramecium octaurelia]